MSEVGTSQAIVPGGIWRFGTTALHETTMTMEGSQGETVLDRSAYEVMRSLLLHAGEVVTKNELLQAGWPGRVVLDNSLMKAISRLRKALGPMDEALLCSVHGYGYRITVPAHYEPPSPGALPKNDPAAFHVPGWRISRMLAKSPDLAVLLAEREDGTASARAFKLAQSPSGLRSLKREVALHGYIQRLRPKLPGLLALLDWNLTEPPLWVCTDYCEEGSLSNWRRDAGGIAALTLAQRLQLFIGLCRTVAELHGLGILHKDIKPQNLFPLDTTDGCKLLLGDLGISGGDLPPGIAASGLALGDATLHESTALSGTALYTAPEVLAGHSHTTRSDLYALGVLLFQMATGDLHNSLAPGWEEQLHNELLCADIAWAAHSDPEKRLGDAAQLADRLDALEDRREYLRQSIEADALAEVQRTQLAMQQAELVRSTQSKRWIMGLSAVLLIGLGTTGWMYLRSEAARQHARETAELATHEAEKTRAVLSFFTEDVIGAANPFGTGSDAMTVIGAIDRAAGLIETRFVGNPEVGAAIDGAIGNAYQGMARYEDASKFLMKQRSLAQKLHGPKSLQVSDVDTDLCKAHYESGAYADATRMCDEASTIESGLGHVRPKTKIAIAEMAFQQGRFDKTVRLASEAMAELQGTKDLTLYGRAIWVRAIARTERQEMVLARSDYREWITLYEKLYGVEHPQTAWAYAGYGEYLTATGNIPEARRLLTHAMGILDRTLGPTHPDATSPRFRLANSYLHEREWAKAIELLRPVVEIRTIKLGASHIWTVLAAHSLAWALAESGQEAEARAWLKRLQPIVERDFTGPNAHRAKFYRTEISTLMAMGETAQASELMETLLALDITITQAAKEQIVDTACLEADLRIDMLKRRHENAEMEQLKQRCTKPQKTSASARQKATSIARATR